MSIRGAYRLRSLVKIVNNHIVSLTKDQGQISGRLPWCSEGIRNHSAIRRRQGRRRRGGGHWAMPPLGVKVPFATVRRPAIANVFTGKM